MGAWHVLGRGGEKANLTIKSKIKICKVYTKKSTVLRYIKIKAVMNNLKSLNKIKVLEQQ